MELHDLTIAQAHQKLKNKEISSLELTRAILNRIAKVEPKVGAYITLTAELALAQAQEADQRMASKRIGP